MRFKGWRDNALLGCGHAVRWRNDVGACSANIPKSPLAAMCVLAHTELAHTELAHTRIIHAR